MLPFSLAAFIWLQAPQGSASPARVSMVRWNARLAVVVAASLAFVASVKWFGATGGVSSDPSQSARIIVDPTAQPPTVPIMLGLFGLVLPFVCAWRFRRTSG
jgi:hypothetical protein